MLIVELLKKQYLIIIKRIRATKKRTILCIAVGIILAILALFTRKESIYVRPNEIMRSSYGTQKTPYHIRIDVENLANNMEFNVSVSARKYTKEEADEIFNKKIEDLKVKMLNTNEDYDHICDKLNFANDIGDGVKASYAFEPRKEKVASISDFQYFVKYQGLIDGNGNVKNDDFKINECCTGFIEVCLSASVKGIDGSYKSEKYLIPVKVICKQLSTIESFKNSFKKELLKSDEMTIDDDVIILPKVVNDFRIRYKEERDLTFLLMPLFGILIAILLEAKDKEKVKEEQKRRKRTLELDFAQIISKLLLYVNSGMTIRNSMIRMAEQYVKEKKEKRVAYEELVIVGNKLNSGYNEIKAYEEMAKNINMRIYTRFINIIIQSIKNGNRELKNILTIEVQDALYERKQHAKKMGEEAATKLVLPLMMMLAVIMVVIMVPAFMGM